MGREWTSRSARNLHVSNLARASGRSFVQHPINENSCAHTASDFQKYKMVFALGSTVGSFSKRMQICLVFYDYGDFKSVF